MEQGSINYYLNEESVGGKGTASGVTREKKEFPKMVMLCFVFDQRAYQLDYFAISSRKFDAADNCVSVEFVLLEQKSSHLADAPTNINNFLKQTGDLENCSFRNYVPGLVSPDRWSLEDNTVKPI
ncbi:hypothetical protein HAX54_027065 [Datura stramonium]|uniref:Uncharacterized protein n=1 Tax=Datura stramonium TaxID=4076 RepID=A0ABS8S8F3_DATST|nr:hypothetical protein [Datura stramonium]